MRLTPDGHRLIYVTGFGQTPPAPVVTLIDDGVTTPLPLAPGHSPRWTSTDTAVWSPQSDAIATLQQVTLPSHTVEPRGLSAGNTVAAGGGFVAVGLSKPRRVLCSNGRVIPNAMDPAVSDDGRWLAYSLSDVDAAGKPRDGVSTLVVERADGSQAPRPLWEGAPLSPRFGGTTLAWEIGRGIVAACADVTNPAVPATAFALSSAWKIYKPVPIWVASRGELLMLFIADDGARGHLKVSSWTYLTLGEPRGYDVGVSSGAGYDHDARPVDATAVIRLQWLSPTGELAGRVIDLTSPRQVLASPAPPVNTWAFAPTGTVVTDGFRILFGDRPSMSADGKRICLHKNIGEQEWREVQGDVCGHLFDNSRYPGDKGWYLYHPTAFPIWGANHFLHGESFEFVGEIVEMADGRRTRWRHRNTFYALEQGGLVVEFDPRFPNQDYGPEKCYEWHMNSRRVINGQVWTAARWELRYTPIEAKGVLAWGDKSMDVVKQVVEDPARLSVPGEPPAYLECPRLSVYADPAAKKKDPPVAEPEDLPVPNDDQNTNALGRIHVEGYIGHLQRAGGVFESPNPAASTIRDPRRTDVVLDDRSLGTWLGRYYAYFKDHAKRNPGADHHEPSIRNVLRDLANSDEARQKRKPVDPAPGRINGRLRVEQGRLRDDLGFYNYQAISAFPIIGHALQGRMAEAEAQVDFAATFQKDLRVFCMLEPVPGAFPRVSTFTPDSPGWEAAAQHIVARAASAGRRVQLNIFADCAPAFNHTLYPTLGERLRVIDYVATLFKDNPAVWFRIWNEPYQNGTSGAASNESLEMANHLAGILGHRDFAIGDVPDSGSEAGLEGEKAAIRTVANHCNILVSHPDRAEQAGRERPAEHMKSVHETYEAVARDKALIFDEPRGFGSERQPGRRDNRGPIALLECATAAILGRGYTYHRIAEQDPATPGIAESTAAHDIPVSPDFVFTNAGLGGSWIGAFEGFYKVRCCDNEQAGYAVGHAPSGSSASMTIQPGWSDEGIQPYEADGLRVELRKGIRR